MRPRRGVRVLGPWLLLISLARLGFCLGFGSTTAPWGYGHAIYGKDVVRAASEAIEMDSLKEAIEQQVCLQRFSFNRTLTPLINAITRCAEPEYRMREISPEHIVWTRVEGQEKKQKRRKLAKMRRAVSRASDGSGSSEEGHGSGVGDGVRDGGSEEVAKPGKFMAFLLVYKGDNHSDTLDVMTRAVVPAFPEIQWLKGDAEAFSKLVAQISLKSFPQLLLFEDGLVLGRFKGPRTVPSLVQFLVGTTGQLPVTIIEPPPRPRTRARADWLYYLSCVFFVLHVLVHSSKLEKKEGQGARGGGRRDVAVQTDLAAPLRG